MTVSLTEPLAAHITPLIHKMGRGWLCVVSQNGEAGCVVSQNGEAGCVVSQNGERLALWYFTKWGGRLCVICQFAPSAVNPRGK
jgi:hypothetical protein